MPCAVYCLLPRLEQLDSLVARLQDAGVQTEDIAVVVRKNEEAWQAGADEMSCLVQSLWDVSLGSAGLWWPLGMYRWGAPPPRYPADGEHTVIPLALFRARQK